MKIVGFDTATDDTVVGATDGSTLVSQTVLSPGADGRPAHSEALLIAIENAAAALGGWGEVDRIAVGTGPGTFTGLRVGVATAAGLRLTAGCPLVPVPTMAALALTMKHGVDAANTSRPMLPVLDARRGEVFAALFDPAGELIWAPTACPPAELGRRIERYSAGRESLPMVAGPGSVRFGDELKRCGADVAGSEAPINRLSGHAICELGAGTDPVEPDETPEPEYLREPDAKLWLERDSRADST